MTKRSHGNSSLKIIRIVRDDEKSLIKRGKEETGSGQTKGRGGLPRVVKVETLSLVRINQKKT